MLENKLYKGKSLLYRVQETSIFYDIPPVRFVCDAEYSNACKRKIKPTAKGDGIVESVIYLFADFTKEKGILLNMIYLIYITMMSHPCFIHV